MKNFIASYSRKFSSSCPPVFGHDGDCKTMLSSTGSMLEISNGLIYHK